MPATEEKLIARPETIRAAIEANLRNTIQLQSGQSGMRCADLVQHNTDIHDRLHAMLQ